jgi:hypothetical protein
VRELHEREATCRRAVHEKRDVDIATPHEVVLLAHLAELLGRINVELEATTRSLIELFRPVHERDRVLMVDGRRVVAELERVDFAAGSGSARRRTQACKRRSRGQT